MIQSTTGQPGRAPKEPDFDGLIQGVVVGDPTRENRLFTILKSHLAVSIGFFLEAGRLEEDDVLIESIAAVFAFIRRRGGFDGDLVRFAITIARNRCRNILNHQRRRPQDPIEPLAEWIANTDRSPLDHLMKEESRALLQDAIDALSTVCRRLLRAFYFEDRTIESIRRRLGLETVQGVYYRRTVCLRKLGDILLESRFDFDPHRD